ncbi:MAG: hypothetical protein OXQ94_04615 [Gemmatimonadota bacterium]|nr:hypothetical protein [Gemmatimonadota bacterium]MDE2870956.1 hypothetical protein [Gemmatimonadota bacterium]
MRTGATSPSRPRGVGGVAIAGLAALTAACASGGRSPPPVGPEAEALFASLTGVWVLDETSRSARIPRIEKSVTVERRVVRSDQRELARSEARRSAEEAARREMAVVEAVMNVFARRPSKLVLRVDGEKLIYVPTPGERVEVPMSGGWVRQLVGRQSVRTRVYWDADRLALEHLVHSDAQVREVLEIVDGRLQMTRTVRAPRASVSPFVLRYDRAEEG